MSEWVTQGRSQGAGAATGTRLGMASGSLQAKGGWHPSTTAEWGPRLGPAWSPERHLHSVTAHRLFSLVALLSLLVCCVPKCRSTTFKLYVHHYTRSKQNGWIGCMEAGQLALTSGASQPHQPACPPATLHLCLTNVTSAFVSTPSDFLIISIPSAAHLLTST